MRKQNPSHPLLKDFPLETGNTKRKAGSYPCLFLTTQGAKTNKVYTTPMMYYRFGPRLIIVAANGGRASYPSWYLNLLAHPLVTVKIGEDTFPARAEVLHGLARQQAWGHITHRFAFFKAYEARAKREIPVIELIEVTPT